MKFYYWDSVSQSASLDELRAKYRQVNESGFSGVFIGGVWQDEFEIIKEFGLELHSWMWTVNRRDEKLLKEHPEWYQVSRSGKSCATDPPYVEYYRWLSPHVPGACDYILAQAKELSANPLIDGVHLDYVRFPDVILPRGLWENYGLVQDHEMADYDFCYSPLSLAAFEAEFGRNPLDQPDPSIDQDWLHFRFRAVNRLVARIADQTRKDGKQITAAVFPTPRMARQICRQDWDKWGLDIFCPMTYHNFYNEPISWIGERVRENIQAVNAPIVAGLHLPDLESKESLREAVEAARSNGAAGVSFFGDRKPQHFELVRELTN